MNKQAVNEAGNKTVPLRVFTLVNDMEPDMDIEKPSTPFHQNEIIHDDTKVDNARYIYFVIIMIQLLISIL